MRKPLSRAKIALVLAIAAVCGPLLISFPIPMLLRNFDYWLTWLGPVAMVLGLVERFRTRERAAYWAVILGLIALWTLPTLSLGMIRL